MHVTQPRSSSTPTPKPTVHKSGPSLKMFLLILLFLGLADACIPREVATEEKIKSRLQTQSLQIPGANQMDFGEADQPLYDEQAVSGCYDFFFFPSMVSSLAAPWTQHSGLCTLEHRPASRTTLPSGWMTLEILGLLSLQVLNEESSGCKEEVKLLPTATTPKKPLKKKTGWNGLRCAYMMVTFLFVSYNKGDWCYCHYCNPDVDNRNNPCCAF
ncbi:epididymal protein 13 [Ovis canadensis]|uniref:epididymal protein 13 n=1 Tax=Ovis canadensis TaxID=37174 RepID=UPI0037521F27